MTELIAAVLQGVVEGLTEFLPVSSTAHIVLTQELLGLPRSDPFWKMFAVFIQLGAILAVVVYFWKRLSGFVASFLNEQSANENQTQSKWLTHPLPLVLISFVVTAVPCLLIDKFIGENLENLLFIGIALIVGGIAMYAIDRFYGERFTTQEIEDVTLKQAIAIGLWQILAAAFPGTSRSMATIAGGQWMGLSRSAALEFSFFLSIPVMFAAAGYSLLKHLSKALPSDQQWIQLGAGFVTSFLVAFVVIAWFMNWVRNRGFTPFAFYRIIAGVLVIGWHFYGA
ncbi:MAG: undecaprenyl-diphosphate phosphatase [Pirellula sp.]